MNLQPEYSASKPALAPFETPAASTRARTNSSSSPLSGACCAISSSTTALVTRVRFALRKGDLAESAQKMETDLAYRKRTQPLSQPNFGSVFTNPSGYFAGSLIEQVGLKGHRVGQAQISTLHANWIVNLGGATAADVTGLMAEAQKRVLAETGVTLTPEVKRLGRFA